MSEQLYFASGVGGERLARVRRHDLGRPRSDSGGERLGDRAVLGAQES